MIERVLVAAMAMGFLYAPPAGAQTYAITTVRTSGPCMGDSKYTLTISGDEVVGHSPIGSGFTAKIADDGSFKAVFKSFTANREVWAARGDFRARTGGVSREEWRLHVPCFTHRLGKAT